MGVVDLIAQEEDMKMARVTVEDSLKHIANRFLLVHATTKRARQLTKGSSPLVKGYRNREIVMALREMAAGKISVIKKVRASKGRSEKKAKTIELKPENLVKEGLVLPAEASLMEQGISIVPDSGSVDEGESSNMPVSDQGVLDETED